ncbi:MAG: hypothetical protein ABJN35_10860 [Erythrobacter sp.]
MDEPKTRRRLRLASRQLALAKVTKREAMAALADAVSEESRSTALAQRSRDLLHDYGKRAAANNAYSLRANAGFVRQLHDVADQAGKAVKDAKEQAQWQVESLAKAETRARRLEEQKDKARTALQAIQLRRETDQLAGMAHKLQNSSNSPGDSRPTPHKRTDS